MKLMLVDNDMNTMELHLEDLHIKFGESDYTSLVDLTNQHSSFSLVANETIEELDNTIRNFVGIKDNRSDLEKVFEYEVRATLGDCYDVELTDNEINDVAQDVIYNDYLWENINDVIRFGIDNIIEEKEKENERDS